MSSLITTDLRADLARLTANLEHRGQRVRPLSVGSHSPFGRRLKVGAQADTAAKPPPSQGTYDDYGGEGGCGGAADVKRFLDSFGAPPCRIWGAEPPGGRDAMGCPTRKKLCIIALPILHSVPGSATAEPFEVLAKVWYWPLVYSDAVTDAEVAVEDLQYTGDPVFENGLGSGAWSPSGLFPSDGNYNLMPGLPAIDNTNGLDFTLSNTNIAARNFQGIFLGVSIRN